MRVASIEGINFERNFVVHFADPAMLCCMYGFLWSLGIQYIDGKSKSSSLEKRPKEDSIDLRFSTIFSLESVVAV